MRISALLSSKGQVTIPIVVRDFLEIDTGDQIEFEIDIENRCVQLFPADKDENCLVCKGTGYFEQSQSECFFCLGIGKIPTGFNLMTRAVHWRLRYDCEILPSVLFDETFTQGLYVPAIEVKHASYSAADINRANEAAIIYQFIQYVAGERMFIERDEYDYLKHLLAASPLVNELPRIFRIRGDSYE